jgi:enamine deaminase RidA (YjgF/YER057c/UK114 family)
MKLERYGTTTYGDGQVVHVPIVRAGNWIFATGLRATAEDGLIDGAVLRCGRPLDPPPKAQREAAFIFQRLQRQLAEAGGAIDRIARLDQYYPDASSVDPYHVARKQALSGQVAPSTSIIVRRLLNLNAAMDVQAIAPTLESGYAIERVKAALSAPGTSGYAPCLRVGDLVFVAGQLARDASGNIAAEAMRPVGQSWNGTPIRLETHYLVHKRLLPALTAAGSSLDLVLKAQVYLSHEQDFPAFWQSWSEAFGGAVPPTTIVPVSHPAFGTRDATIEINVIAAHASARSRVRDIECDVELIAPGMLPARSFDGLLFVAGLMALDPDGLAASARCPASAPFYADTAALQMRDILKKARAIFDAAGADLRNVVRALQFHTDLADFRPAFMEWQPFTGDVGVPFTAIEVARGLFVPGARVLVDLWGCTSVTAR